MENDKDPNRSAKAGLLVMGFMLLSVGMGLDGVFGMFLLSSAIVCFLASSLIKNPRST